MLVNELINTNHLLQQELHSSEQEGKQLAIENSQVLKQLELRIKYLHEDNVKKQKIFLQWQENQSQDKFYNRAFKLVEKGASLEEIMSECELPRAEVEMLMSVHKQRW
jgi:NADPH:quinone reductase-like Zn-dependent oxidoreductase